MKKMIAALAVLFSITLSAQNDAKAKALLDEVYTKVNGYENIYVDFKYVLENTKENIKQETKGNVTLQKNKYLFNYLGATKMFDGKKTYTVVPENEEVIIETSNGDDEGTITPSKMLTFYKQGYKYKWDIAQNVKGRQIQYVELIPISSNSEYQTNFIGNCGQTKHIYNLIETGKNGTKTNLTVNSFKTNQPLSKSLFTFDE